MRYIAQFTLQLRHALQSGSLRLSADNWRVASRYL